MATKTKTKKAQHFLSVYRTMQVIRQCEEQLARLHQQGLVHGACHTYIGEEAIAATVCGHLRTDDVVFSTHRGHGHALAKGVEPKNLIAELLGRKTGVSLGRGGSMHLFCPEIGLMGTSGIVGPCILQAVGAGYSFKVMQTDRVAVAFFGDGAVNNGAFHEGMNMASIWDLPVLLVCENNQFATEVPFGYSSGIPDVGRRAENYGIPGFEVDGNDVVAIDRVVQKAVQRARKGEGATLLECKTYRTRAHAEGMGDFDYRTREEVDAWKERSPLIQLKDVMLKEGLAEEKTFLAIEQEVSEQINQAREFAEKSDWPDPATVRMHVRCETPSEPASVIRNECPSDTTRERTFMQATHEALSEEMERHPYLFVLGEGIGKRGGNFNSTTGLYDRYGSVRLCDTPICERGFVGLSAGAAMTGSRPVIDAMFADFILDSVGETINQIAKMQYMSGGRLRMPLLIRGCIGIGHSAATHHSGNYHQLYAPVPGLCVVLPSMPYDAKGLLKHALNSDDPVIFLEPRELLTVKGPVPEQEYEIEFGKASVVREGTDVTVVALGVMVHRTLEAAELLKEEGVSLELIDPRTISPLDTQTMLQSVHKTGRLLIIDEAVGPCGVGAEIAAQVCDQGFDDLDAPIRRVNGVFAPTPYSPPLEQAVVPQVADIVQAVRDLVEE